MALSRKAVYLSEQMVYSPGSENNSYLDTKARWIYGKTTITRAFLDKFQERAQYGMTLVQDRSVLIPLSLLLGPMRFKHDELNGNVPEDYIYWVLVSRKDNFEISDDDLLKLSAKEVANLAKKNDSKLGSVLSRFICISRYKPDISFTGCDCEA